MLRADDAAGRNQHRRWRRILMPAGPLAESFASIRVAAFWQ
jgi:hypothetical protein